jgi:hypothetical protein
MERSAISTSAEKARDEAGGRKETTTAWWSQHKTASFVHLPSFGSSGHDLIIDFLRRQCFCARLNPIFLRERKKESVGATDRSVASARVDENQEPPTKHTMIHWMDGCLLSLSRWDEPELSSVICGFPVVTQ